MPNKGSTIGQRTLQVLVVFAMAGMGFVGLRLLAAGPCDIPKTWSVGTVDPGFNLSKQMVAQYGKEATEIWNESHPDSPLFAYRENGGEITLNFIYDERMQTTIRNERLKRSINEGKVELTNIKETLESLKTEYANLEKTISSLTKAYTSHLNKHNKEVSYWNSQGGAPKDTYAQLQKDEENLEDERSLINTRIQYYNQLGERIRTYGENHNDIVDSLNEKITTLNESAAREFEEGIYDPNDNSITVYEYASPISLKRVLTHEFGHALSIGHVEGENSIMYPVNEARTLKLSVEDLAALQSACKGKSFSQFFSSPLMALDAIRDDISRLVRSSLTDITAQAE